MKPTPRDVRWLVDGLAKNDRRLKALENRKPSLAYSSIEDGAIREFDKDGVQGSQIGKQPDGTHGSVVLNGPKPPKPTNPVVAANPGQGEARWNGKFVGDVVSPLDLKHVAAYFVLAGEFLDLSKQAGVMTGELGDNVQAQLVPGVYSVYLVSWSLAGRYSDASDPVTLLVPDAVDTDWIQGALDDLDEKYEGVITEAGNLGTRLDQAEQDITAAESGLTDAGTRLDDAFGQIGAVDSKATAAAGVASSAQSKADTAKSAADQAAADALAASGLAGSKGEVIHQASAPTGSRANAANLWIRTSDNKPHTYDVATSKWVARTDKAATDAASAAATAKSAADAAAAAALAAQTAAGTAQQTADNALTMAGTKARVYYSTSTPSGTASTNDIWRQIDATKNVIGEWYWASGWVKTLVSSQAISNLDVGKLTVGAGIISDLVAEHIAGRSARFIQLDVSQLVAVTGTMSEAVINRLFADVVMSRKITASMIAVGDFNNLATIDPVRDVNVSIPSYWATKTDGNYTRSVEGNYIMFKDRTDTVPFKSDDELRITFDAVTDGQEGQTVIPRIWTYYSKVNESQVNGPSFTGATFTIGSVEQSISTTLKIGAALSVEAKSWVIGLLGAGIPNVKIRNVRVYRMNGGEMVIDGSLKAIKIDTDDLAANNGFIAKLVARIVTADMFVGKAFIGGSFTGTAFQTDILPNVGVKFDGTGFRAYGPDGGEPIVEISANGVKAFGITDPETGESLITLDNEGGAAVQTLAVADEARIDGVLIMGGDPLTPGHTGPNNDGSNGPVFLGRSLFGGSFTNYIDSHPNVQDHNAWMTAIPHGIIANAWRTEVAALLWDGLGGEPNNRIRLVTTADFVSGRMYQVTYRAPAIRETSSGSGQVGSAYLRASTNGGTVSAGSGKIIPGSRAYIPGGGGFFVPNATTILRCPQDIDAGTIMLGAEVQIYSGRKADSAVTEDAARWEISVMDVGISRTANAGEFPNLNQQGTAPAPTPPAPKPPAPQNYTRTENHSWHRNFNENNTPYSSSKLDSKAVQGRSPYYTTGGAKKSMIGFPSFVPFTSGTAVITKVEVYVYAETWNDGTGGTLVMGYHGTANRPGGFTESTADIKRQKMKRGEGRWITLPSSVHAAVKNGNFLGITLRAPGDSTNAGYYGYVDPTKKDKRARMRVTIRK